MNENMRFNQHIKFVLSEYTNLKLHTINYWENGIRIICEMDNKIRTITISKWMYDSVVFHLEHDKYYNSSTVDFFDMQLKLTILEAFYVTKIDNQDS